MQRRGLISLVLLVVFLVGGTGLASLWSAEPITGIWLSIADDGKTPESVALMYQYQGKVYGRMIVGYNKGVMKETLSEPKERADKVQGNPLFMGIDYVYQMVDVGTEWQGLIMDPRSGDEFDCKVRKSGDKLLVRGQLKGPLGGLFGRDQVWKALKPEDLPPGMGVPDTASWVPVIPRKK